MTFMQLYPENDKTFAIRCLNRRACLYLSYRPIRANESTIVLVTQLKRVSDNGEVHVRLQRPFWLLRGSRLVHSVLEKAG